MNMFHSGKFSIEFIPPVTPYKSVENRKYSIACLNDGEMCLTIGNKFTDRQNDFCAEWVSRMGEFILKGTINVSKEEAEERNAKTFFLEQQEKLKNFLIVLIRGDKHFFRHYPWLLDSPIYIEFQSTVPQFNRILYFGTPRQFLQFGLEPTML